MRDLWFFLEYYMGVALDILPVILLAGIICILIRWRRGKKLVSCQSIIMVFFVCYLSGLLALTAVPANFWARLTADIIAAGILS